MNEQLTEDRTDFMTRLKEQYGLVEENISVYEAVINGIPLLMLANSTMTRRKK
jgi:hypothetical protein